MAKLMTKEQVAEFIKENNITDGKSLEDAFAEHFKEVIQAILEEEMDNELGYSKYDWKNKETNNSRNGHTKKKVKTKFGNIDLKIPRDTDGEFEPVIIKKHQRNLSSSIEDMIISMYAKGMSNRDIDTHIKNIYKIDVSPEMVSRITDKVIPLAKEWQNRPLDEMYAILWLDGIVFKVRQDGHVIKKTVYLVTGRNVDGKKEVLGIWIGEAESARFWGKVLTDLRNRGVEEILIASVDGLKGFVEAIESTFPLTEVQKCIVHQIRTSTRYVSWKHRKEFCKDMKQIYQAPNEEAALEALDKFEEKWGEKYSYSVKSWRDNWAELSTFFKYPEEIRRMIYTTNPIESLNRRIRKVTKTKSSFPTDDSLLKLLYLVVMDASEKWSMSARDWGLVINQLRLHFGDRMDKYL